MIAQSEEDAYSNIRFECHDKAFHAFANGHIFERRAKKYKARIKALEFAGLVVPVVIGGIVIAYGPEQSIPLNIALFVVAPFTIVLLVISTLSLVYQWSDKLSYSSESSADNYGLSGDFKELGTHPPQTLDDLKLKYIELKTKDDIRSKQDIAQNVKPEEDRRGMRKALIQFQRECVKCEKIPDSMASTDCPVCGNF